MTIQIIWTCDGCGDTSVMDTTPGSSGGDWKRITVTLDGFRGYPVGASHNATSVYELCPDCQNQLAINASPRRWPRHVPEVWDTPAK